MEVKGPASLEIAQLKASAEVFTSQRKQREVVVAKILEGIAIAPRSAPATSQRLDVVA